MTSVWLFCLYVLFALVFPCTAEHRGCKKTLSLCGMDKNDFKFSTKGLKGEKGDIGLRGEEGERGPYGGPGLRGNPGKQGLPGPEGIQGDVGDDGNIGSEGLPGNRGEPGIRGMDGKHGQKGDKGVPGSIIGPPGPPGINGSCPCTDNKNRTEYRNKGSIKILCKDVETIRSGGFRLDFSGEIVRPIKVACILEQNASMFTCIQPQRASKPYPFKNKSTGFWLSKEGLKLKELYGVDREVITWIQKRSNSAFQTIRYHCYNTIPFRRDNANKSTLLLTWNDNTIGPMPTLTKPYFYSIEYDGCSNNTKNKWDYTDIRLVSTSPRRVPVIDFFIRDIDNELTQEVKIEPMQLCFD